MMDDTVGLTYYIRFLNQDRQRTRNLNHTSNTRVLDQNQLAWNSMHSNCYLFWITFYYSSNILTPTARLRFVHNFRQ